MTYTSTEVVRATGVSYRQLDYWCSSGLIVPSVRKGYGSGSPRLFSEDDLATVRLIKVLLKVGISLRAIREHGIAGVQENLLGFVKSQAGAA